MTLPTPDPAFRWSTETWGHALRCRELEPIAQHAFTTRQLQLRGGPEAHPALWSQAIASVGAGLDQLMRVRQVHGRTVRVLRRGAVATNDRERRPDADAIVSNEPGLVLAVQVADCVPILMADPHTGGAAAVHAGWRGTCAGIAAAAVETLSREFGTRPEDLVVAIGPSIGACCYQVGPELVDAFRSRGATEEHLARWFTPVGPLRLDLWAANIDQLHAARVLPTNIHLARLCTQTHSEVFDSYRVAGAQAGRMAALIRVPAADRR